MTDPCEFLSWDTEFFHLRIARVNGHRLDQQRVTEINAWLEAHSIACLYFLADTDDPETIRLAEDNHYRMVDVRLTFERSLAAIPEETPDRRSPEPAIRLAAPEDVPLLQEIASNSYPMTRFYFDPNFSRQKCSDLYDTWIKKSCNGYADAVLVAEIEGQATGYVTCHLNQPEPACGQIGLMGIGERAQGRGIGQRLIYHSLAWFASHGMKTVEVVTQGRNIRAQRLYQRCGFVTKSLRLWYHLWIEKEPNR